MHCDIMSYEVTDLNLFALDYECWLSTAAEKWDEVKIG